MNQLEKQIRTGLSTNRKDILENLIQLENVDSSGWSTCDESAGSYHDWLEKVDDTFERLERGEFNLCRQCAGPSEDDCLLASPATEYCQKKTNIQRLIRFLQPAFGLHE